MHLVYLHGYATSPASEDARVIAARLAERGIPLHIPDLNVPDFDHLTMTAILARVAEEIRALSPGAVGLIGNSLGGAAAVNFVHQYRHAEAAGVTKLALIAPAIETAEVWQGLLGEEQLARWRDTGTLDQYHYLYEEWHAVHYGFYEDLTRYPTAQASVNLPTLLFHGTRDEAVDYRASVRFAAFRPHVDLRLLDGDHRLLNHLDAITDAMIDFFGV